MSEGPRTGWGVAPLVRGGYRPDMADKSTEPVSGSSVSPDHVALEAAGEDLIANAAAYREKWMAEARRAHPHMTEEQHEAAWRYASDLFGLE